MRVLDRVEGAVDRIRTLRSGCSARAQQPVEQEQVSPGEQD